MPIKIIKDVAGTTAKVEGIDVNPIPLNSYLCSVAASSGNITIFNPNAPNEEGNPTKIFSNVPFTNFVKSDGSTPASGSDLKSDIDAQLIQEPPTDVNARYRGKWDAASNTPDLNNLEDAPINGDWYYSSSQGTFNSETYLVNDVVKYNGSDWERIPAALNWDYIPADNSYDITSANNRNFVDYTLTSNKDITLPTLSSSESGWMCTIVNSSNFRLRVLGTTSGSRQLRQGGSIQLLFFYVP